MDGGRIPNNPNPIGNNVQENRANARNQQRFNRIANAVGQLAQAQLPAFARDALMHSQFRNPQEPEAREHAPAIPEPVRLVRQDDAIRPGNIPGHLFPLPTFSSANPQDPF